MTIQASAAPPAGVRPQSAEDPANTMTPSTTIFLWPTVSASRPPKREERGQRQQVGIDRPLHTRTREPELSLDLGSRDGDDRLVDERHRNGENHGGEDQVPRPTNPCIGYHHDATVALVAQVS